MTTGPGESPLLEFAAVMRKLRAECPWKREQTHRSLVRYLLEEAHETVEAIETGTPDDLREELGDLLLQVYFHAVVAEEEGWFTLDDVAAGIVAKMVLRNPHVFPPEVEEPRVPSEVEEPRVPSEVEEPRSGVTRPLDAASVNELWESIKAVEKQERTSVIDGIAPSLPALLYADKVVDRLARSGRVVAADAADGDVGERLLALVLEAHDEGVDPEQALRDAVRRRLR